MSNDNVASAHMAATLVAAFVLLTGIETIVEGPIGLVSGTFKFLGGFLIFLILGVLIAPIGFLLRRLAGLLPIPPKHSAVLMGASVGLVLIPILHPAMAPPLSFLTNPIGIFVVHALAGITGGLVWHRVEFHGVWNVRA